MEKGKQNWLAEGEGCVVGKGLGLTYVVVQGGEAVRRHLRRVLAVAAGGGGRKRARGRKKGVFVWNPLEEDTRGVTWRA